MPHAIETIHGTIKHSYSVTETAVELRKALKTLYPGVTFSVKSKSYSGGASIRVSWTDGPTVSMIEPIARNFSGASFDGMVDLKSYHTSEYQGQVVDWGPDYIFCERAESLRLMQAAADRIARKYLVDVPPIVLDRWGSPQVDASHPNAHLKLADWAQYDITDLVYQEARKLFVAASGLIMRLKD